MFDTSILKDKIEGIKTAFENGKFADALVAAVNTGSGLMQQRVFTQNEDVEGQTFGQYVGKKVKTTIKKKDKSISEQFLTAYQKKRAKAGRQIAKKDLEFSGGVRRAIETVIENDHAVILEFNNSEAAKIARGQENQISNIRNGGKATTRGAGVRIFRLNKAEKEEVVEQGLELVKQIIKSK